ncbi:MAG TPA: helix-turn-helix transcriptional regulator, partial [Acidimicrobiia bacterium]|nr:helix-turn-helix transcriptional regulator [Acidimicrobiia bacterium]
RAARKRRGWKRSQAASHAHISPQQLREYERGERPVPSDVCEKLADAYGTDLSAHVPLRVPPEITADWLVVGEHDLPRIHGTAEEIVREYALIVQRLRRAKPGEPLPLRAADLAVLGAALEADASEIAARVAVILECSVDEARRLHREMLRRKVVLPAAGLAASMVALAGISAAHAAPASHVQHATVTTLAPRTTTTHVTTPHTPPPVTTPPVTAPPVTAPPVTTPTPPSHPNDPPVSVLPGETPVTIIGTAISTPPPTEDAQP